MNTTNIYVAPSETTPYEGEAENYGPAVERVYEREDGTLWATNEEYLSQVNFCPFTGYKARVSIEEYEALPKPEREPIPAGEFTYQVTTNSSNPIIQKMVDEVNKNILKNENKVTIEVPAGCTAYSNNKVIHKS